LRIALPIVAAGYALAYWLYPSTPGNWHALGWWGWFDQGQYLLAANAFAQFDLSPDKFYYPPLYPFLGALFVQWWGLHPFWLIDLAGLVWFSAVFILFASRYVSRRAAVLLYLASVLLNHRVFPDFLIPWTTTVSAALLSVGLYGLLRVSDRTPEKARRGMTVAAVLGVSLSLGLIACLRPVDSLVGGIVWLGCMGYVWRTAKRPSLVAASREWKRTLGAGLGGLLIGPAIFLAFNYLVFGSVQGRYVQATVANGYFPADLAEKFVSLFFDGYALYLEPRSGIAEHFPWMALSLLGLGFVLLKGDWLLRTLALALCAQFILYLPYSDLLPTGVWRFHNLHYFKWTFPYMALLAWLLVAHALRSWRDDKKRAALRIGALLGAWTLLVSLSLSVDLSTVDASPSLSGSAKTSEPFSLTLHTTEIDLIDVTGMQGEFADVYFGRHRLWVDGVEWHHVRDYRVLPAPWGIRVLFIRPVHAKVVQFQPDERLKGRPSRWAAGSYHFAIGIPGWFRNEPAPGGAPI
jgi:hypothetical protein